VKGVAEALEIDARGLEALREALPGMETAIARALEIIESVEGRLIVTGLGKSGHVAAKLAATFSSTGTPAYFLHPAEASHGDLGMVRGSDAILALSWSGETRELGDVIAYAKRHGVPLIAMTSKPESSLGSASDVVLSLPRVQEACPHGLAPTTSTLLQLALGDAMAVTLLDRRGFDAEAFHRFHPGGSLGAQLTRVAEVMATDLPLVQAEAALIEAVTAISDNGRGIVGVLDGEALAGVITDGDLRRHLARSGGLADVAAGDVMTKGSLTLSPQTMVGEALRVFQSKRISAAFVVDGARPVGLVTMLRLLGHGAA
jgi:arabinose-5-phosphate isomerase